MGKYIVTPPPKSVALSEATVRPSVFSVCLILEYRYDKTVIGNPVLEVELTDHRGRMATGNGRNIFESEKVHRQHRFGE